MMIQFSTVEGDVVTVSKDKIISILWEKDQNKYWVNTANGYEFEVDEDTYVSLHGQLGGMGK
jgi:hypothetical protein